MLTCSCTCSGDRKVIEAIELMNTEGISSLAVVDSQHNVVGNISTADVKVCAWSFYGIWRMFKLMGWDYSTLPGRALFRC